MNGRPDGPSPALLAAQRRLEELRRSFQPLAASDELLAVNREPLAVDDELLVDSCQPSAVSLRPSAKNDQPLTTNHQPPATNHQPPATDHSPSTTRLHPDIALGMLGRGLAAPGRIWLLLRYLDKSGRGWLHMDQVQERLCHKESNLRVCGRRQLLSDVVSSGAKCVQRSNSASVPILLVSTNTSASRACPSSTRYSLQQ